MVPLPLVAMLPGGWYTMEKYWIAIWHPQFCTGSAPSMRDVQGIKARCMVTVPAHMLVCNGDRHPSIEPGIFPWCTTHLAPLLPPVAAPSTNPWYHLILKHDFQSYGCYTYEIAEMAISRPPDGVGRPTKHQFPSLGAA